MVEQKKRESLKKLFSFNIRDSKDWVIILLVVFILILYFFGTAPCRNFINTKVCYTDKISEEYICKQAVEICNELVSEVYNESFKEELNNISLVIQVNNT